MFAGMIGTAMTEVTTNALPPAGGTLSNRPRPPDRTTAGTTARGRSAGTTTDGTTTGPEGVAATGATATVVVVAAVDVGTAWMKEAKPPTAQTGPNSPDATTALKSKYNPVGFHH